MNNFLMGPNNDQHNIMYNTGKYTIELNNYNKILSKYYKPTYFDVGSNIGYFAVNLANICNSVHCFEPVSYIHDFLINNTKHIDNIICNKLAIANHNGESEITISSKHHQGSTLDSRIIKKFNKIFYNSNTEKVNTITLSKYIEQNNINKIHLLKIDCEGMEYEAIISLQNSINLCDNIIFESYFQEDIEKIKQHSGIYGFTLSRFRGVGGPMFLLKKNI